MFRSVRRAIVLGYLGVAFALLGTWGAPVIGTGAWAQSANVSFRHSELSIESGGKRIPFKVEIAETDEQRALGLMYRTSLPADAGMLFDFKHDQDVAFWMRNTRIPLDMLFIDRTGRIVNIAERAVPFSEETIPSAGPVLAVLELNGGTASRLGLKPGDRVIYPIFGPPRE
ncbi:MAG: DUF192 domain-containing protein [Alphaproteobacteria bacterium]|nr:DUF192 domain-containing protein [Alphaproteobacteria bacterium]